jgi:hypothetical protein
MQLTVKEKQLIAYERAYVQNKTGKKIKWLAVAAFLLLLLDLLLLNNSAAGAVIGFCILFTGGIISQFIRRPEKRIAESILKEE